MKRIILATTIAAATFAGAASAEQYVCQMEQAVGFDNLDNGEWRGGQVAPSKSFLVDTETFLVREFGTPDLSPITCIGGNPLPRDIVWACSTAGSLRTLIFNETSLRFSYSSTFGYAFGQGDTPILGIGTCAELGG